VIVEETGSSKSKWGANSISNETPFPPLETVKTIHVFEPALYLSREFLHQKYCEERLSTSQIAALCFSSRSTILKYMEKHGIARRKSGASLRRPGYGLAYGRRVVGRFEMENKREMRVIEKMHRMRKQGLSYAKIAIKLNAERIPTKTRRGRWGAKTVHQILHF
jgi:hypothetical protein